MVRLYIIRHADPDYDTNRAQGGSLTDHGRLEAAALGAFLKQEGITHVHSSPMGRARLTAELALQAAGEGYADMDIITEEWARELSTWRQVTSDAENYVPENVPEAEQCSSQQLAVGEGSSTSTSTSTSTHKKRKPRAVWDIPASLTRARLNDVSAGTADSAAGWTKQCPDHAHHYGKYMTLCDASDAFLKDRHGIVRHGQRYGRCSNGDDDPSRRRIAVFCHAGTAMTWLSHLLGIPLPMVHSSFWLAPSSVTTILFDEYNNQPDLVQKLNDDNDVTVATCNHDMQQMIWMTPRAICVGGTNHLAMADLATSNSKYESWERPSGIKCNYW